MFSSNLSMLTPLAASTDWTLSLGMFLVLVLAVALHEFGHAGSAYLLGDPTAKKLGRVTVNPIPHLDPVFSVALPLIMIFSGVGIFGAGKPVPVDMNRLRRPNWDMLLISLAGPAMNVLQALSLIAVYHGLIRLEIDYASKVGRLVYFGIGLNLVLAVLNLIPVPPLDGHRVLGFLLPEFLRRWFYRAPWLGMVLFVILIWGGGYQWMYRRVFRPIGDMMAPIMPYNMSPFV